MTSLNIIRLRGQEIAPYLSDLANLRITVFHDFPYLYAGDLEYEKWYLNTYLNCSESVMVTVFDGSKVVGASTAIPLSFEMDEFKKPFIAQGFNVDKIFYFGESVLLPAYRGKGIGKRFFMEREAAANESGKYHLAAFCSVERSLNHPKRPPDYLPLNDFWQHRGFVRHPELMVMFPWQEIGEKTATDKPLIFWLKELKV